MGAVSRGVSIDSEYAYTSVPGFRRVVAKAKFYFYGRVLYNSTVKS
jgi:hypothetical protein